MTGKKEPLHRLVSFRKGDERSVLPAHDIPAFIIHHTKCHQHHQVKEVSCTLFAFSPLTGTMRDAFDYMKRNKVIHETSSPQLFFRNNLIE